MKKSHIILRMLAYLYPHKKRFLAIVVTMFVIVATSYLQPIMIKVITDYGIMQNNIDILIRASAILLLVISVSQAIELIQAKLFLEIHNETFYSIFAQTFQKLLHLEKSFFGNKNSTEILSVLQTDAARVSSITDRYVVVSLGYALKIIGAIIGMFSVNWKLAMIVLTMIPVKYFMVRRFSKQKEKLTEEMLTANRDFSRWYGDIIGGINEIKIWNLFKKNEQIFHKKQENVLKLKKDGEWINALNTAGETVIEWGVTILLYIIGGALVCNRDISVGSIVSFISYTVYVTGPISLLFNVRLYFAQIIPSAERLFEFLDMKSEDSGKSSINKDELPVIEFRDVKFRYGESIPVLKNINFTASPGEKIAIIGPNGSGKSTIVNLLLRFYVPEHGEILVNGKNVRTINLEEYRDLFSVVSQEPFLFIGNISENIDLAGTMDIENLDKIISKSGLIEYVNQLPEKEKTMIGVNGFRLSGGEKQKIAVARALIKNAPIVILDEATSGFDVESDADFYEFIFNQMKDRTVILITHDFEHLDKMDRVYRLHDGQLISV